MTETRLKEIEALLTAKLFPHGGWDEARELIEAVRELIPSARNWDSLLQIANDQEPVDWQKGLAAKRAYERAIFDAGFRACLLYGDNHAHFEGEQAERVFANAMKKIKAEHDGPTPPAGKRGEK